jgi:3-methylcrotonyl-CoA carboxylase alpha subunit
MNKPIKKLLIANRGEIACRVIRTARELGVKTVAVFSDVDRNAMHVQMADEAIHIGPAAASESYLVKDKIIEAAQRTNADAIHPGYGFLSENPEFADLCAQNDVIFIGPSAKSMNAMALKGAAKKLMEDADVPVVPGYHGDDQSDDILASEAERVGYPLLIKAVAGGGGKGMRKVYGPDELKGAIEAAKREGQNSFGNPKLLIEKLIEKPRHIELQVFGDHHGNVVHLFERDCSLQRRHQKVVEEAPAPGLSDAMRKAMGDAAVKAAEAIDYVGAGTVEFIVDVANGVDDAPFYFMEMNTRLQVEHPVTELISGQDLVEWQIRVSEGHELPYSQDEIDGFKEGHAVEVRLYAEDPYNDFLPATGTLSLFDPFAVQNDDQRIDTGVNAGDEVSIHYDPMIAKMIAYGNDREAAIDNLIALLETTPVTGLRTNRDFLIAALDNNTFRSGDVHTGFIDQEADGLLVEAQPSNRDYAIGVAAILTNRDTSSIASSDPWDQTDNFRLNDTFVETFTFIDTEGENISVSATISGGKYTVSIDGQTYVFDDNSLLDNDFVFTLDGHKCGTKVELLPHTVALIGRHTLVLERHRTLDIDDDDADGPGAITAPMPGKILDVKTWNGASVERGDPLIVMEAMKMEQTLTAPKAGIVSELSVKADDQVSDGTILLKIIDDETS